MRKPTATCKHAQLIIDGKWHYLQSEITEGCWGCSAVLTPAHLYTHTNLDKIGMDEELRKQLESDPVLLAEELARWNLPMWECKVCMKRKWEEIEKEIAEGKMIPLEECFLDLTDLNKRMQWLLSTIAEIESCVSDCPDRDKLPMWKKELEELQHD